MPGEDKGKRRVPPPPPAAGASTSEMTVSAVRRVPPPPPSAGEVKKKDLSVPGSSTGLQPSQNTGQPGQGSAATGKIYSYKEKPDNEYTIINNQWQRRRKGTDQWTPIENAGSVNALNQRHKQRVPVPQPEAMQNMQQGLSLLNEAGKPIGTEVVQPMTSLGGQAVSGSNTPTTGAFVNKPSVRPILDFEQQNAANFAQGKKVDLDLAKAEELKYAQTPEQIAQVEQRYSSLSGEQDLNIAGTALVPQTNKEFFKAPKVAPPAPPAANRLIPVDQLAPMEFTPASPVDVAAGQQQVSDQISALETDVMNPFNDPASKEKISQYQEVANRDLDEWRKVYGAGLSDEQFKKLKLIQDDIKKIAYDVNTSEMDRAALLDKKQQQIDQFLDDAKYVNAKYYRANIEGKSIEDVLYEDKKEKADAMFEFAGDSDRELLGSESLDVEREIFDAESNLRDFLDNYVGVGQGTFIKDPETGELKLQGFKSKEDEEYFNQKYKELSGAIKSAKGTRYKLVNDKLVELTNNKRLLESYLKTAEEGDMKGAQDALKKIDAQITDLKNSKRGMLLTEPKEILKTIAPDVTDSFRRSFSGLPDNLTPKQKFDMGYSQLFDKTMELKQQIAAENNGFFDEQGMIVRDWLDWETIGMDLTEEEKEYFQNMKLLNALRPIYSNNDSGIMDENQGFFESFLGSAAKAFADVTSVGSESEREKARLQKQGLAEMGASEDELTDPTAIKDLEEKGKEADLMSAEFAGETLGVIAPLIADLVITKRVSAGALKLLTAEKNVAAVVNAYDKAISSTRLGRYLKEPLSEAVNAELAGNLFGQEEELNFESFLLGGTGSKLIGGALSKLGGDKAAQYISSLFGESAPEAAKVLTKMGSVTSRGVSEVGEESIQELTQIYNDELRDRGFWDEVEARFGSTDDIMKFVVSSFVMGSAFGMVESKSAKEQYDAMPAEQRAVVDAIVQETAADVQKATDVAGKVVTKMDQIDKAEKILDETTEPALPGEVSEESPIVDKEKVLIETDDTGESEYKIGDKFYSEKEIASKLDDQNFINQVNNGDISLSVKNPSEAIQEKISPTPKVENFEQVTESTDGDVPAKKTETQPADNTVGTTDTTPETAVDTAIEEVTQEEFADAAGKTDQEIIRDANNADEGITADTIEKKADVAIQTAVDTVAEGQAPVSSKAVVDSIIEKAKEINLETGLKGKKLIDELAAQIESSFDGKITKEDLADIQGEVLAEIPKEVKAVGKSVETITKDKFSAVSKAIRDKKFTSSMSDAMSQLKSSPLGTVTAVIDGAMEVVATTIDQAGTVAQAIDNGLQVVRESDWYKNLSDAGKNAAESLFKKNVRSQINKAAVDKLSTVSKPTQTGSGAASEPGKQGREAKSEPEDTDGKKDRKFGKRVMESENVRDEIKEGLSEDAKKYVPISNDVSLEEADAIISEKGADQAFEDVMNLNNGMDPRARVTLGIRLIEQFNASENEADTDRAVQLADTLSQFATKLGQGVQAFAIWSRLSVANIERSFNKKQKEQRSKFKGKNPELISGAKEGYDAGTGKAAKKAVGTVFGKNTIQAKKAKAFGMDKDQIDQRKKDALAKIRKATKGGGLTSGGVNVELIEALGEYGFILFADGVRTFKEWSARMRSETGIEDEDVLRSVWMDSAGPQGKSLNDLSAIASVETVVAEFFAKNTDASKLTKKLQDTFGLDQETALGLAGEIAEEFEKIVVNARNNEMKKRTPRLTKKALKAIDEIAESNGLTKEEIEGKIYDAFGLSDMKEGTASRLEELAKERDARPAGMLQDDITREILSLIAKEEGIKTGDIFWSVWYASVLSGYETQILNIVSNSMNIAMEGVVSLIEKSLLQKDPLAIGSSVAGLANGMKKGWMEFEDVLSKGYSPERLRSKLEIKDTLENVDFWGGKLNPLTYYKYVGRFMSAVDTGAYMAAKGARKQEAAREIARLEGLSGQHLARKVSDLLNDTEQVQNDATTQATREVEEIATRGFEPISQRTKSRMIKARTNEIIESKTDDKVIEEANKFAEFVTYNYDPQGILGWAANGLSKAGEKFKPFKLVVPFTRIVANVLNQQLDYFPLTGYARAFGVNPSHWSQGLVSTESKSAREKRRQLIKATMGTLLMTGLYMMAAAYEDDDDPYFDITGKGPSDFNKKNQLMSTGWKPYHIKIGNTWINYQYTPFGFALSWVGNWRDNEKYKELSQKDATTKLAFAVQSSASGIMDMSFLTGLSGLMSGLSSASNPENISDRLIKSAGTTATSLIPNIFKQADKLYDPTVYDSKTVSAAILKDIPILRRYSGLNPKINSFGQPVEKMGNRFFTIEKPDPIWDFMAKHRIFAPGMSQDVTMPDGTLMTDDQVYEYAKISGQLAYERIKENMPAFEDAFVTLDTDQKKKVIGKIFTGARKQAKGIVYLKTIE